MIKNFFNVHRTIFTIISLPIILYTLSRYLFSFSCIIHFVDYALSFLSFNFVIAWAVIIFNYLKKKEKILKNALAACVILSIIVIALCYPLISLIMITSGKVRTVEHSPNGENSLVVFEGGFITAVYEAYPIKYKFFYQHKNSEYVSEHDHWGRAEIEIEWLSNDKAVVRFLIGPLKPDGSSNENHEIIVTFD